MPSLAVQNFGCRANQAEAFAWAEAFEAMGLRLGTDWSRSDLIIVNSCTLTGRADRDVRKFIRRVVRERPEARLVVTGCLAERAAAEISAMPGVAAVVSNSEKEGLPARVRELVRSEARALEGSAGPALAEETPTDKASEPFRSRAWLKVQDGCDGGCTYCVIPSVRGRSRSLPPEEAVRRVRSMAARGFREIVLTGIHLSSYGRDLDPPVPLVSLLTRLAAQAVGVRLRLSSLDPRDVDGALVEGLTRVPGLAPHFHLSLQHVSPGVLKRMGRAGPPGGGAAILRALRDLFPEAALGADLIVGFPGETEDDFASLLKFVESSPLSYLHVFPYSPREGTPAAARPRPADRTVKARVAALRRLSAAKTNDFRRRFFGRELEAVVIRGDEGGAEVLTANNIPVLVPRAKAEARALVRVIIEKAGGGRMEGRFAP